MGHFSDDLALAHVLADAADRVSMAHYRSEVVRVLHKDDGTPVSQVDQAVEKAMLQLVLQERPDDALLGEEIGAIPGLPGRRWIFDGVDGTHNYTAGRAGWGTIVALEVEGQQVVGMVSSPAQGRRWWAEQGGGAWTAPLLADGSADLDRVERLRVAATLTDVAGARIIAAPSMGALVGWRGGLHERFEAPESPRSQCFALDAIHVASGALDGVVITFGNRWDYAATRVMVTEAGGEFCDAWGGDSLDTQTAVFTAPGLQPALLAAIADGRPEQPDVPVLASAVRRPIAGDADSAAGHPATLPGGSHLDQRRQYEPGADWSEFGIRRLPTMSARKNATKQTPPFILDIVDERRAHLARPLVGVTTDGIIRPRRLTPATKVSTAGITEAAQTFLQALNAEQRTKVSFDMGSTDWRTWINVHMNYFHHGLMLEDVQPAQRELALDVLRATLSARAFLQARMIMRINGLLAELTGEHEAFGEWPYFFSIFGTPGSAEPWGWQIDGHHLCMNCVVFEDRIVMTPSFMGSEPRSVSHGPLAGVSLFDPEEAFGLDLIRSFDAGQLARAVIYPSIHPDEIPPNLQNLFDGRMVAGAFHDNLVAPYQGVAGHEMTDVQRRVLLDLAGTYVGWNGPGHAEVRLDEVAAHLDETWFSWYGGFGDHSPFYYRVHSPVILIEFDHHPGVAFDNEVPSRHHVHTVVRTPNGGDYGADLLRQHHEQFDHSHGHHT